MTYKPSDVTNNGSGVRVLRSSNIEEDRFVLHDDDVFVKESAVTIELVHDGEILITAANGSSKLVGKRALIHDLPGKAVHGGFMIKASTVEPAFINAVMGTEWYRRFLSVGVSGGNGALGNLNLHALTKSAVLIPCRPERDSIGAFFSDLDDLITLHQRELTLCHAYFFFNG